MTVTQRRPKLTVREERDAYELATLRDRNICQRCRRDCGPVARDHRQNRDAYNTVVSNLQCLGLGCHQWKTEHPTEAVKDGWAVPRHTIYPPSWWPAARWFRTSEGTLRAGWVLLDDEGGVVEISAEEARERQIRAGVN